MACCGVYLTEHYERASETAKMTQEQQKVEELLRRYEVPLPQYTARITGNNESARDVVN